MKPWVAFLCLQLAMIAPQMCRCEPARGRVVGLLEHRATCANTPEVQAYDQLAQIVYEHVGSPLAGLGVYDPGSVNAQWGRELGETALFAAALEGTRSQINWQPGRVGRAAVWTTESRLAAEVANPVPTTMARVIPEGIPATTLGRPGAVDVYVTAAEDIAGLNAEQIARRLRIPQSPTGFRVIEFPTPEVGVASPVFRSDAGFVGGGRTSGGAREFVIPNQPIPENATIRIVR